MRNIYDRVSKLHILSIFLFLLFPLMLQAGGQASLDLNVTLNIQESKVEIGQPYTNAITISNLNTGATIDAESASPKITYSKPSGSTYNNSTNGSGWSCTDYTSTVECSYGNSLTNGQTSNVLNLIINAPSSSPTTLNPDVNVTISNATDPDPSNNEDSDSIDTGKSNLHATKTASKTPLELNEQFDYTIDVSNPTKSGDTTVKARNVTLSDTLPSEISYVSLSAPAGWNCSESSGKISCSGLDLAVDDTETLTITVKATSGGTNIVNTASVSTDSEDYNSNPSPSASVDVNLADVVVSQTLIGGIDSSNAAVGSSVTYRIHVSNSGTSPADNVTFGDTLPPGVTFVSSSGNWSCTDNSPDINCTLDDTSLSNSESYDLDLNVKMPDTHGDITNKITAYTTSAESDTNNDSSMVTHVKGADLDIEKTPDGGSTDIGTNYTYTIKVTNNGLADAQNVTVEDTLDSSMTYVSDSDGCSVSGQVLNCDLGSITAGNDKSFTVTVTMPTDSLNDVTNSVDVSTTTDQENNTNISDTATTHITGPNLNITKDANVTDVGLGKTFSYTIGISNVNSADATNADIEDQLPSGIEILSILSNPDGWSCPSSVSAGSTFHCTKDTMSGNTSESIVFEAKAPDNETGSKQNTATISHSLNSNDGSASVSVNVTGVTLSIDKTASSTAVAGGTIDYSVKITNTSHSDAEDLTLTDDLSTLGSGYTINSITDSDGWNCSGTTTLSCTKSSLLAEGDNSTITFKVNVPTDASLGTVTNTASVTTTTTPSPTESDSASTTIEGADIVVVPPSTTTAVANENVVFTVKVRNDGSATAKDVNITNYFNTNATADFTNILIDCDGGTNYTTGSPYKCQLGDIAKNETKTITISATAPNYDSNFPGNSKISNGSLAVTSTSQSDDVNDNADWSVEIHGADLVVYKTSDKSEVPVDGIVTYTINVKNQWEATATNVQIDDNTLGSSGDQFTFVSGSLNYDSSDWSCNQDTSTHFSCTYKNDLAQNQTTSDITIQAKAPNTLSAIDNDRDNQVDTSTDTAEQDTATTNTKVLPVTIRGADLTISKTVSPNPAKLNESVTYTITVTNNGLAEAKDTNVSDTLPNGFTNISTSGCDNDGSNISGQSVNCTLGDLAQNASKSFTITTNAPNIDGDIDNTATTSTSTLEKNTANNSDTVTLQVQGADLIPHKTAPARVAGNSTFTYVISLANTGSSTAYGAEINDTIPTNNGTAYVSGSLSTLDSDWTCSLSGSDIHCYTNDSNLSIPNGYNHNIVSFQVKAGPAHYWIHNTAITGTDTSESNTANNSYTADTEVINVDLQARKLINNTNYGSTENYININGTLDYKIQVRNGSLVDLNITDVNITDILPDNVTNISINADSRFDCSTSPSHGLFGGVEAGDKLFCTMKDADTNPLIRSEGWIDVATITVNAIDSAHFDINNEDNNFVTNKYKAETSLSDQNLANNAPTADDGYLHTNTLVRGSNMSITKTVSNDPIGANKNFFYTLSVRNWPRNSTAQHDIPSTTATNIVVKDTLPNDVNFTSASGTNWSCSENSHIVTCNYSGDMPPANSASNITLNVTAPNTDSEVLTNEANVTNDTPELARLLPDNTDNINTTTQGTDITVSKTGPDKAGMSDKITYSINVTNQSAEADAKDVFVIDTLPNGASFDGNISDSHWSSTVEANGSIKFSYDQDILASTSKSFTFSSTLPNHTGTVRNHVEAHTSTVETSTPNVADWDTDIEGANIVFKNNPTQSPNPVGAYGSHQYHITIRNQGYSPASDINVTIDFNNAGSNPGWSDINGTGTNWSCDGYDNTNSKLICHLSTLANNTDSSVLTISSVAPNYNGDITNNISVIGKDETNTTTGETKSVITHITGSDIKITKYAKDPDPSSDGQYHDDNITVGVGKPVDFKFSIKNNNLGLAKEITLTDTFPTGFSDFNITDQGDWLCSFSTNTLTCKKTELAPNTDAQDILVSAKTSGIVGTTINTADINTTTIEVDTSNDTDNVKIKLEGATLNADLNVSKTEVAMDELFTYALDITNTGRNDAIDVNVTDILPSDFAYVDNNGSDSGWTCNESNNTIICNQSLIPAYSGNSLLKLNIKAPENKIGIYQNSETINSNSIENPITAYAPDVRVIGADLTVDVNATPTESLEDRNVTYVIHVKDINISTAKDIHIGQTFAPHVSAIFITNDSGADCNLTDSNNSVECTLQSLEYNKDINITIVATMPSTDTVIDPLKSTTTVSTVSKQEDTSNDSASVNVKVLPIKPVANYRFEECKWDGTDGEVKDSINNLNGTAKRGADTLNHIFAKDDNNFSTIWRVGVFDGNDDYINIPNNSKLQIVHNQTICLWIKPSSFSSRKNPYEKAYGGEGTITQERSGRLSYYFGTAGRNHSPYQGFSSRTKLKKDYWNHACIVRNFDDMKLYWYIDGVLTNTIDSRFPNATASNNNVHIGRGYAGKFKGNLDEVEIYNIALDAKAVKDIYNFEKNHKNYDGTDRPETICGVDLQVIKTSSPSYKVGAESSLNYTITVQNLSNEPVTKGYTLTDIFPNDVNYSNVTHSSNLNCDFSNDTNFTCQFPDTLVMKKGDVETLNISATTANVDKIEVTNTATATPVQPEDDLNNNTSNKTNKIIGTDLKITKTATPRDPNHPKEVYYDIKVENISDYADAKEITVTDHYDSRLKFISSVPSCVNSITSHTFVCTFDSIAKHDSKDIYITMSVNQSEQNLINEANVSSATVDTDLSNNSDTISVDVDANTSGVDIIDPSFEDFRLDGSVNKYGNIATIGNTILVAQNYNGTEKLDEVNSTYANSKGNTYFNSSSAILNIIDSNNSNPDDNITIEYASLLWGGHIHGDDKNQTGYNIPFNSVKFITPDGVEHTITASKNSPDDDNRTGYYHFKKGDDNTSNSGQVGNFRIFYGARADITSIIKNLDTSTLNGGEFTVANMMVTKGTDSFDWAPYTNIDNNGTVSTEWSAFRDYGYFGGWTMVVAYSVNHRYHREVKFKNLSSFSGFKALIPTAPGDEPKLPIDVSGFITPLHGNIESSLFTFIQGGDKELALEGMTIEDKNSIKHSAKEEGNNTDNIFNDTITLKNIHNADISRNPFELYNVGTDADQYNLDSFHNEDGSCAVEPCYLSNQQNQTTVEISVKESNTTNSQNVYESEQAFAQMMSMQTQIFTPDFIDSYKECFKLENPLSPQYSGWVPCDNPLPLLRRGDTVKYRLTVINTGDDYAKDVYILDHLPDEITYEQNSSIVTNLIPFEELETNSPCSSPDYEYNETIREECSQHLQNLIENNSTSPLYTVPPVNPGDADNIDHNYNDMVYTDTNNSLVYKFDPFPKNNIVWIEFNATINGSATLGKTFKNKMSITFTNPTLADYNLSGGTITQVSLPVESSPIHFNWDNIKVVARDIGRNTVGAKIVNAPFDLNISLAGISPGDQSDANTSIYINSLRIIDAYNGTTANIYPSVINPNVGLPLTSTNYTWLTHGTKYANASKELGFDMNISIKSNDGNYTDWKMYPYDFNSSAPYAGDVFTTRPKEYSISLTGATATSGGYSIVKAGNTFTSSVNAIDYNGANSNDYNASLTKGIGISVGLDTAFSTNPACISQGDLNISALSFNNGQASTNTLKYKNVGVVKLILKDINWTAKDSLVGDCNTTSIGDNNSSDADGLISCSVDGNSTSIIFEPDHFTFTNNTVADHAGGSFTYMVPNPILDAMFGTLTTTVEARASDGNITTFYSNTCFADDTNINLSYDMQGKDLNDINLSIANDSNISVIQNTFPVSATGNNLSTIGYGNNFANGTSTIKLRIAVDRNMTTPLQPALWNAQNLKGSVTNYLGVANANVPAGAGTDINTTTTPLHFLFGRVHAPDYRFSGNKGIAKIYYEVYCKDCSQTYRNGMNIFGLESVDYVDWYANTLHTSLNDGNVSVYKTLKAVKFGTNYATALTTTSSNAVNNGVENINVVIDPNKLPYIDKVEINATDWVTFSPKDFILEFQNDQKEWAGQGKLGHTIDTNVSKRSNRRLNW